ncbi:MAG: VOC family protein [Kiloniellaceae bacterium]
MSRAITGVDHVLVGVRDLEAARLAYRRLGFTVSSRGRHVGWGTANYCLMFPANYVELLGIVDPAQSTNKLDEFLKTREGVMGVAFACDDAAAAAKALRGAGIDAEGPKELKRVLEAAEGESAPAFKLVDLPAAATPGAPAFLCQHLSRPLVWQAPWLEHANGARGLVSVTGVVGDPGALALAYGGLFGFDKVRVSDGFVEVATGGAVLRFTTPDWLGRLYPGLAGLPAYPVPWLAGLRLAVRDLAWTAALLESAGTPYFRDGDRLLRLPPQAACGVLLEFAAG